MLWTADKIFQEDPFEVETEGPWIKLKKPLLQALAVLNPVALAAGQRRRLTRAYEELAERELRPLPELDQDDVRGQIDSAFTEALGIRDDLTVLRRMMAQEPVVVGARQGGGAAPSG